MEIAKLIIEFIKIIIWPLTIIIILKCFINDIRNLLLRVRKANLPGGISLETFPDEIKEAKKISKEIMIDNKFKSKNETSKISKIPITEANAKMISLGLSPSPSGLQLNYYYELSDRDPNLALAGLRMEIEIMLKNVAKGFNIPINKKDSINIIAMKLREKGAITTNQNELISSIVKMANSAIHGVIVTNSQAKDILKLTDLLKEQYINWLSWGFPDKN